jgi:hypothetical protein
MEYGNVPLGRLGGNGQRMEVKSGLGNGRKGGRMSVIKMGAIVRKKAESATRFVSLFSDGNIADGQDDILPTFGVSPDSLVRPSPCLLVRGELIQ